MGLFRDHFERYQRRINPHMLARFETRMQNFRANVKHFPEDHTRHRHAWQLVRKELAKYQLNGDLIKRLDAESAADRHESILRFLDGR